MYGCVGNALSLHKLMTVWCRSCNKDIKVAQELPESYVDSDGTFHEKVNCDEKQ